MKLGEISTIETGLILSRKRARNKFEVVERYKVLSLNNIEAHGDFNETTLETFASNDRLEDRYFTKVGDILLRLNEPYTAVYIQEHHAGVLIPSYFVAIKMTSNDFLPEYVSWYLNTDRVKRHFLRLQSGTKTPNINQKLLRDLDIPHLSLTEQQQITKLHQLYLKERRLLGRLMQEKDTYYRGITNYLIKEKLGEYDNGKNDTGKN